MDPILERYQALEDKVSAYTPGLDTQRLYRAFTYADAEHKGQLRKDGTPYIYGFVASHNKDWDYMYGNHHEKYDVDETILHRGAAVAAQFAADYLAETAQQ